MDRIDDSVLGDDLGTASVETRGSGFATPEPGGRLLTMPGIADDD